jgi:hypothetical protein
MIGSIPSGMELHAQTTVTRKVIAGGGGTTASSGHTIRGTLSQTAVGRLTYGSSADRHNVGFWYWALRPEVVTRVSIPQLQAEPGTRLMIPLNLETGPTLAPFIPRPFRARIRFNHTLLHAAGSTPACTYDNNDCVIEINGIATVEDGVIAEMEFIVALGNAESTPLTIEEFTWEQKGEERIATVREHGELQLLGVCREGDQIRLIRSGSFASRIRIWPNPVAERATLEFVSAETGPVEIRLVDMLGNDVAELVTAEAKAEQLYRLELDLGAVASGSYVLVYSTPSGKMTQRLLVTQ